MCVEYLRGRLPYEVPAKSSCVFCPYRTNQSWLNLKQSDPAGWDRAVKIDTALRADVQHRHGAASGRNSTCHRTCEPLVQIDFGSLAPTPSTR